MMAYYLLSETAAVNMGVYLCRGYLFMSQHTLDGPQIGSAFKQVCGE